MVDDGELYSNLLKATDNLQDITFTRYATVTKLLGNGKCDVKESDNELIHNDVPILNGLSLLTGDTVVLGFVQNSLYNAFVVGVLNRELGSGGGGGLEFCQALVDAYTTYTLTLSETEITTVTGDVTIIATLKANDTLLVNKTVWLYDGSTLVATETTDNTGNVSFDILVTETTLYTLKYKELASNTCNVIFTPVITLNLESSEITTSDGTATINATLLINNNPYTQQNIQLYNGTTLVSTETTDNDGDVSFTVNVTQDLTVFTLKYSNDVTATCTVYYKPYTFPLDGTDGIRGSGLSTGDGVLTLSQGATGALTDFYIDNNELWEVSCEIYANEDNWRLVLYPKSVSNKYYGYQGYPNKGVWKTESINGYTTIDLSADFKLPFQRWFEFKLKKTSSNTVEITVDGNITTITDNRLVYNSYLEFGVYGWQSLTNYIRHIRLDPAIPNE